MHTLKKLLMALSGLIAAFSRRMMPPANPYNLTPLQLYAKHKIDSALDTRNIADIRLPRRGGSTYLAHIIHQERGGFVAFPSLERARRFRDEHMDMFGELPNTIFDANQLLGRRGPIIIDTCEPRLSGLASMAGHQGAARLWDEDM